MDVRYRFAPKLSSRSRGILAFACIVIVVGTVGVFIAGQLATGAIRPHSFLVRLYPGTWPPPARGILWLVVGVAAVVFDLLALSWVETISGKWAVLTAATVAGVSFLIFSIASFAAEPWSVIH